MSEAPDPFDLFSYPEAAEPSPMTLLSPHQLQAGEPLLEYLTTNEQGYSFARLKGYAGTGKSFLLARVLEEYGGLGVGISAPTHKAVRVIKRQSESPDSFVFGTIHSLFGLTQSISEKGIVSYKPIWPPKPAKIDSLKVLVVDEASMLDMKLFNQVLLYLKQRPTLKIVFCGDPLQAPPVGEKESHVFTDKVLKEYKVLSLELNEPMRQSADNPILSYATAIRSDILRSIPHLDYVLTHGETGIEEIDSTSFKERVLSLFDERFDEDQDFIKVLAWTNAQVNLINDLIRKHRLKTEFPDKIVVGDYLVADKPIVIVTTIGKTTINTSEEMEVVELKKTTTKVSWKVFHSEEEQTAGSPPSTREEKEFNIYKCMVLIDREGTPVERVIDILHESEESVYNRILNDLKTTAIHAANSGSAWKEFYSFQSTFAAIKYNYSLTLHKSQGSSYENCAIILPDMDKNPNVEERNKLRYVAVTRARKKLFIIT